ncbi:Myosin light chain kinase A [Babesia sp. Xinjiang]|uniref:Myosin light chain kinase A n=1 Tax=Babesia sp. Xinjiang TaxID=462227 RepID=UPI000A253B6F|nr:Myosin light chain kinase A [Babesia sp. Xinjiang]ORM41477.1 Myosin light chain kinase A [Babesia sp. Xinjiang]
MPTTRANRHNICLPSEGKVRHLFDSMRFSMLRLRYINKEQLRRFDSNELEVLFKLYKELASRSEHAGITKETFLQYFNLPGLWGERLFRYFDTNESGCVEFEEFVAGIAVCCRGTRTEKTNVLFHVFDLDDDGRVQKSELVAMLSNFPVMANHMTKCLQRNKSECSTFRSIDYIANQNTLACWNDAANYRSLCSARTALKYRPYGDDMAMTIEKQVSYDTLDLRDLASSISKLSFQSELSSDTRFKRDSSEHYDDESPTDNALTENDNSVIPILDKLGIRRGSGADYIGTKISSDLPNSYGRAGVRRSISVSSLEASLMSASPSSSPRDTCIGMPNDATGIPCIHDLTYTNKDLVQCSGDAGHMCSCLYRNEHDDFCCVCHNEMTSHLEDNDPPPEAAMAVIQHEKMACCDGSAMDFLVEQILEDCEFSANGSLDFDAFKAWLDNNPFVLSIFSEYMHEEVWILYGNAFMMPAESRSLLHGDTSNNCHCTTSVDGPLLSNTCIDVTTKDANVQNMVQRLFMADYDCTPAFSGSVRLDTVPSGEMLPYPQEASNNGDIHTKPTCYQNSSTDGVYGNTGTRMAAPLPKQPLSCPNCNNPFLKCTVCLKKHEYLSLTFEGGVHIECKSCIRKHRGFRFARCWICNWNFSDTIRMVLMERLKHRTMPHEDDAVTVCPVNSKDSQCNVVLRSKRRSLIRPTVIPPTATVDLYEAYNCPQCPCIAVTSRSIDSGWPNAFGRLAKKAGYMYKRGRRFRSWKRRYYVLVDNILYYYSNDNSAKPRGCIFLEGYDLDCLEVNDWSSMFGFSLSHRGDKLTRRTLYLPNREDCVQWLEALSEAMNQQSLMQLYTVREQLGYGKFSVVYRAIHKSTGEEFAIKIVDKTKISCQERELLRSEIAILRLLRHRHVIYLKEVCDMRDSLYIVMELVRGGELYDLINQRRRLTEAHTHKIMCQLLQIVAYLHKCGIVHRDIKPENILITDKSDAATIKLTDFGLSTLCGPNELLTQPCGTLAYVAPEVLTLQGYNQKADVWSVGVIMYLLLRGRLPFSTKTPITVDIYHHYRVRFEGRHWAAVSTCAKDLISRMLKPDPAERISVFEALDHFWVQNFVAVQQDEAASAVGNVEPSQDFIRSLSNATDSTVVIPYSESCIRNLTALQSAEAESALSTVEE